MEKEIKMLQMKVFSCSEKIKENILEEAFEVCYEYFSIIDGVQSEMGAEPVVHIGNQTLSCFSNIFGVVFVHRNLT